MRILGLDDLAARRVAIVEVQRELRMVQFHGPGLARLGTTAEPTVGADYAVSQALSRALWQHGDMPDGIVYRSRHDDSGLCLAGYDRIEDHLTVVAGDFLTADSRLLGRLLKRYDLGLTR